MEKIRVLITEDSAAIRESVRAILGTDSDIEIVGEANSIPEMIARVHQVKPDVVLLNVTVAGGNHLGILRQIKEYCSDIRIMAVTMANNCEYFFEVPRTGTSSYLVKTGSPVDFLAALRELVHSGVVLPPTITKEVLSDYAKQAHTRLSGDGRVHLTHREQQILKLTAEGYSNNAIAAQLSLRPSTVRTHRASIMVKLGLPSRTDLVKYALQRGFITIVS